MAKRDQGGLTAALARLDDVSAATDMDTAEYLRRRGEITKEYLDKPSGGLIDRAVHGDKTAIARILLYAAILVVILAALLILGVVLFADPTYLGGDT